MKYYDLTNSETFNTIYDFLINNGYEPQTLNFAFGIYRRNESTLENLLYYKGIDHEELEALFEEEEDARTCCICGKEHLKAGFCIDSGAYYYCSKECLLEDYTEEEREKEYNNGEGDSYRTTRED